MTYDWSYKERMHKKVILCNASDYQEVTSAILWPRFTGMGKFEWENFLSNCLAESIRRAMQDGEKNADITSLFSCELMGRDSFGEFKMNQEHVKSFLLEKVFELVSENDDEMVVALK